MTPATAKHVLAPPFGLPPGLDDRLLGYLRDEDWGNALTLLRDAVPESSRDAKLLVLLAHCRYRDALETMADQKMAACQEALALLDRAAQAGMPYDAVAPLREEVEATLAEETAHELSVLAKLPPEGAPLAEVPVPLLEEGAYLTWDSSPSRAGALFEAAAEKVKSQPGLQALQFRIQAGICFARAGELARAKPYLTEALNVDLATKGLDALRAPLEAAATQLLLTVSGAEFKHAWQVAMARGDALGLPFPSVWPNQEALLTRALALGERTHALAVARAIEDSRDEVPRALFEVIRGVRAGTLTGAA